MHKIAITLVLGCSVFSETLGAGIEAELKDGVISYLDGHGRRKRIDMPRKCADLWIAPDETVLTFITIDQSEWDEFLHEPSIQRSSIYIARRSESFVPRFLDLKGFSPGELRFPKLLPDRETVVFMLGTSTNYGTLFTVGKGGKPEPITNRVVWYCVVWRGEKAGSIFTRLRVSGDDGVAYPCYEKPPKGPLRFFSSDLGDGECTGDCK